MNKYKSRKFLVLMLAIGISSAGLFLDKIQDHLYIQGLIFFVGLYFGADVSEKQVLKNAKK